MDGFLSALLLAMGILIIVYGGDLFVNSAIWIAKKTGVSEMIIGATVVSLGTTLPELSVSLLAIVKGGDGAMSQSFNQIAVGNALGSMLCNIGLVLALVMCVKSIAAGKEFFLKGIYLKRTRRFELAETVWKAYFELPHIEEACFTPSFFYALWGECCLHRMDEAHAKVHFLKVRKEEEPLVWEYVQSLLNKKEASAEDLNEAYWQIVIDACCQNNVTPQSLKESIDAFFAPPEIEDDEEEEDEEEQDEEVDEEDNGEEECGYTFDDWYADAEGGDSLAQLVVGHLYYMGGYVTRNYRLAREWFYLSALQGNAVAQMNLAYMYAHGYGTEIDEPEAAKWRQKAETNQGEEMQEYGNLILTDE